MRLRLPAIGMAIALLAAACGAATTSTAPSAAPASAAPPSAAALGRSTQCERERGRGGSVLRVARLADHYNFWHPVQFQTGNQFQWWSSVFNTLVEAEADSKTVIGDLAATFDVSPDATVYTFHLAPNVKWHDGEAFTADDVMFTVNWTVQNYDAFKGFLPAWNQIKGAEAVKGTTNTPEGLKKIDDSTVEMTLAAPNARFLYSITDMANVILPEHVLKDVTAADVEKIDFTVGKPGVTIGTGPYKLAAFTADQSVELEAFPDYFKGAPKIQKIIFKLFADPALAVAQLEIRRPRPGVPRLARRVRPAGGDPHPERHLGSRTPASSGSCSRPRPRPGATSGSARRSTRRSTARRSSTTSTRAGPRSSSTRPGSTSTTDLNQYEYNLDTAKQLLADGGYKGETVQAPLQPDLPRRPGDHAAHPERPAGRRA